LIRFGKTATQGDFAEGWRLPWEYLWYAEHGLLAAWCAGVAAAAWVIGRRRSSATERAVLWMIILAAVYALMILFSNGLAKVVVYGRLARQLVPLLCLITAWATMQLVARWPRLRKPAIVTGALLVLQAGWNLSQPFAQRFPDDVLREVTATYGKVAQDQTILGPATRPSRRSPDDAPGLVLLNAGLLYPVSQVKPPPAGKILLRAAHPQEFLPYQYEAFTPEERLRLRSNDISMRLIDVRAP
jgi:hypothetical protein